MQILPSLNKNENRYAAPDASETLEYLARERISDQIIRDLIDSPLMNEAQKEIFRMNLLSEGYIQRLNMVD